MSQTKKFRKIIQQAYVDREIVVYAVALNLFGLVIVCLNNNVRPTLLTTFYFKLIIVRKNYFYFDNQDRPIFK